MGGFDYLFGTKTATPVVEKPKGFDYLFTGEELLGPENKPALPVSKNLINLLKKSPGPTPSQGIITKPELPKIKLGDIISSDFLTATESKEPAYKGKDITTLPKLKEKASKVLGGELPAQKFVKEKILSPLEEKIVNPALDFVSNLSPGYNKLSKEAKRDLILTALNTAMMYGMTEQAGGEIPKDVLNNLWNTVKKSSVAPTEMPKALPAAETPTLKAMDKINAITIKEAGERIVAGDKTVLPHIKEGVDKFGPATVQDNLINKGVEPALEKRAEAVGFLKAEEGLKGIRPELNAVLEGGGIKPPQPPSGVIPPAGGITPGNIPPTGDPVNKIIQALKESKPIRGKQEAFYAAERAKRTARIVAMGQKVPGQAGYYAQLGQLKGEMPKIQFESIKDKIGQVDIDALFQKVEDHQILSPFEKITAKSGLEKLVGAKGGTVPTKGEIDLLSEVFPPEFISAVMEKRPLMEKLWHGAGEVLNLPRAMMATADLSAPLRQGIFLVGRPKQWIPAFRDMFKYAFSEEAYQGLATDIRARPNYKLMRESKLALTDLGENMIKREEAFMSNLSEKIPIFGRLARGSNRAYSGFLNKLRADTFDSLVKSAKQTGVLKERPEVIHDIAKFVNSATGRGSLGAFDRAAVALNGAFFSPRLMASRFNLLNPVYYIKLDPFVRKEALKSLFTTAGTAATILGLAKLGGAQVGTDPRSADFAKIKIGNTRFDILGGFQQYMVLASRLVTNQMVSSTTGKQFNLGEGYKPTTRMDVAQRFFESKTSPVGSFILGMARGKTSGGDEFDLPVEITNRFIPMLAQDMFDLYKERGLPGIGMGIPGIFGTGMQTYAEQIPLESRTKTGKPTIKWAQEPGLAETIVNKARGTEILPVPVKAKYDEAQALLKQGKIEEARKITHGLSKKDYELYKKFKQKDKRIKRDEAKAKIEPIYQEVKKLLKEGKMEEARKITHNLTPEEYIIYQQIKDADYKLIL